MHLTTIPMEELVKVVTLQLENGGSANLVVTGSSMHPMLRHRRDTVHLVPLSRQPKKGDLILYRRDNGKYILHRIVTRVRHDAFFCSGDNQWEKEAVSTGQIIALVQGFTRKGKFVAESNFAYRLYVAGWVAMLPIRRPILALRRRLGRLRAKK